MRLAEINMLSKGPFVELLGAIYEHSPWVAEQTWPAIPFASREALLERMRQVVDESGPIRQLDLIRAHPDLGTRAAIGAASAGEQKSAGLDRLTAEEYASLTALNESYRRRFGFPFILAVRGASKFQILAALDARIKSSRDEEFSEALAQVHRIAGFRLTDLIEEQ